MKFFIGIVCSLILFLTTEIIVTGCSKKPSNHFYIDEKGNRVLIELSDTPEGIKLLSSIQDTIKSKWELNYYIYQFQKGDINNDRQEDVAVGVIKRTRYDSLVRKRIFLFEIRNQSIIPLWLGSSVGLLLEDFKLIQNDEGETFVRIIGREADGSYLIADYRWFGFGLSFQNYVGRQLTINEAKKHLNF